MTNDAKQTTSVLLAGVGGQGVLLGSEIIARTALLTGADVKTNEVHGMAQRGGSVLAEVRYGEKVYSPLIAEGTARVIGAFERIEALRFAHFLAPDGLAVVSSQMIVPVTVTSGAQQYPADAPERLRKVFPRLIYVDAGAIAAGLGNTRAANVVLLGAMSTGLDLPLEAWRQAVSECVPQKYLDINLQAFETGRDNA